MGVKGLCVKKPKSSFLLPKDLAGLLRESGPHLYTLRYICNGIPGQKININKRLVIKAASVNHLVVGSNPTRGAISTLLLTIKVLHTLTNN